MLKLCPNVCIIAGLACKDYSKEGKTFVEQTVNATLFTIIKSNFPPQFLFFTKNLNFAHLKESGKTSFCLIIN